MRSIVNKLKRIKFVIQLSDYNLRQHYHKFIIITKRKKTTFGPINFSDA